VSKFHPTLPKRRLPVTLRRIRRSGCTSGTILKIKEPYVARDDEEESIVVMKVSTTTVIGVVCGFVVGLIGLGRGNGVSPDLANVAPKIHQYMLWIVLLSLLVPLADYFVSTGLPASVIGYVTRYPFRHLAGFFTGLAAGLLFLVLIAPQVLQTLL
jgi:hypothetical protein